MKYIFGNWKAYLDYDQSNILAHQLLDIQIPEGVAVVVFPTTLAVPEIEKTLQDTEVHVGAQNVHWAPSGAYTGASAAALFAQIGCAYALVGHSERRHIFGETDDAVRKKVEACIESNIAPIVCVGETKDERISGKAEYRVKKQLMKAFDGLELADDQQIFVAYEPVWAISKGGVGEVCLPEDAGEMLSLIKAELAKYSDRDIPLIYGGSVKPENMASYLALDLVSGVLPGHASTSAQSLSKMVNLIVS